MSPGKLDHSAHHSWLMSGKIVAVGSLLVTLVLFAMLTLERMRSEADDRRKLVDMTNAFTSAFADERGEGAVVPATFRRIGMDHFSNLVAKSEAGNARASMRMPGTPGLEIRVVEQDARLRALIARLAKKRAPKAWEEHRLEGGRFIGRTVFPSIASSDACVSCHNDALGAELYKVGDVMGAFVVDTDLTAMTIKYAGFSILAFGLTFWVGTFLVNRERRRIQGKVELLEERVKAEQEKHEAQAYASFLASHDGLTGLANRRIFISQLDQHVTTWRQTGHDDVLVAVVDLDDFKTINDTMGHDAGDALLAAVAARITAVMAPTQGLAARLGGDEFSTVVRASADIPDAEALGALLLAATSPPLEHAGRTLQSKCSVGAAALHNLDDKDASTLLKAADIALYAAKNAGKNRFRAFDADLKRQMGRHAQLAEALPGAIANQELSVAFQPKIDLKTGEVFGFEALARWTHEGDPVPPDEFVKIAEEKRLVRDLDLTVLRLAARHAVALERRYGTPVRIASNLSALSFAEPGLSQEILDILLETGLPSSRLTLEVTETVLVGKWSDVQNALAILTPTGVRVSLDDFGTGYSSLSYLRRLHFDEIKIDRSFLAGVDKNRDHRRLFDGVLDFAIGIGRSVVVEGIECADQAAIAREGAATYGQGYHFAKPMPPEEAGAFLAQATRMAS